MPTTSNSLNRLAAVTKPGPLRSLLRVVNDNTQRNSPALPAKIPNVQPRIDFEEVTRLLLLAKTTLQEERQRILGLKDRIAKLRGFEEAFFKNKETIEELRADRDLWRTQAVAMSNWLLSPPADHQ
jgi:hypothetical protein